MPPTLGHPGDCVAPAAAAGAFRRVIDAALERTYDVAVCDGLLEAPPPALLDALSGRRSLVVATPTVAALYGERLMRKLDEAGVEADLRVVALGEPAKTPETLLTVCSLAQSRGLGRKDVLVAFGGGVCCDVVRTAAALYRRGLDYICLPTTLIGQIDAALGVKGAVNFNGVKSALGVFYAPVGSWIDPALLCTLPAAALRDGLAEILKVALVCDGALFRRLETDGPGLLASGFANPPAAAREVLERAIDGALDELQSNLYERQVHGRLLDFGHTFSPLIEARSDYRLTHGQAVAIDIAYSTAIAAELGLVAGAVASRIYRLMAGLALPCDWTGLDGALAESALDQAARHRDGRPDLVLPCGVGRGAIIDDRGRLPEPLLVAALERLRARAGLAAGAALG